MPVKDGAGTAFPGQGSGRAGARNDCPDWRLAAESGILIELFKCFFVSRSR